jgi:hypothetical protein
MSQTVRWRGDKAFSKLCDLAASDRLVCITGAGISVGLPHARKKGEKLPGWGDLLASLHRRLAGSLSKEEKRDVKRLLGKKPTNDELIEAATVLRRGREETFDKLHRDAVSHRVGATDQVQEALLELQPRGIMTYNYDLAQENAIAKKGLQTEWDIYLPWEEEKLHQTLQAQSHRPFLLKAHGSLDSDRQLVLTYESYRELLVKFPVYRTFVQNLLINYSLLIVGFGLSDPDFDQFIESLSFQLGAPLREHIVIRRKDQTTGATLLRRRYGIHTLYVDNFDQIPAVIKDAVRQTGPELEKTIEKCLSPRIDARVAGHTELEQLGPAGKTRATHVLRNRIEASRINRRNLSEIAYSLGKLDPAEKNTRNALFKIVEESAYVEPVAHALLALQGVLKEKDLPWLKKQLRRLNRQRLKSSASEPDPDTRLPVYLQFLILYVRAKYSS